MRAEAERGAVPGKTRGPKQTFGAVALELHRTHSFDWTDRHATDWLSSLRIHADELMVMRCDAIGTDDVLSVLRPLWNTKPATAKRLRHRIGRVLNYAMSFDSDIAYNVAGRVIDDRLPRLGATGRHRAVRYDEVGSVMNRLGAETKSASLALQFLILTGTRSGETRNAEWVEIMDAATWSIPRSRMKGDRPHRVPLSTQALVVLADARMIDDGSGLVFPSPQRPGQALSAATLRKVLSDLGIDSTVHGFRSSLRQWLLECSGASWAVAEACLAHTLGNAVERAYVREADLFDQRRVVMAEWGTFVTAVA